MKEILTDIPYKEDLKTLKLFKEFENLKNQEYLSKEQIIKILMWKSPRPKNLYLSNSEDEIKEITEIAFKTKSDTPCF